MEPKSPSKLKLSITRVTHYKRTLKIILTLLVLLLLVSSYVVIKPGKLFDLLRRTSYFTVVVDCGSTGTRVNVYEWSVKGLSGHNLPMLVHSYPDNATKIALWKDGCKYHCMQSEPGLDKFVGNYSKVRSSLEPLIHWAEQFVPSDRHGHTPIFVLATAGLRRLAVEDAKRVMRDVEDVVKEHSFLYNRKSWVRVLSGKEEAYYGWVALNYKMGSLGNSSAMSSLGLLDLGGSSLQVVMEVDNSTEDEHLMISKIGSAEHRILTYSLPAFGLNEAFDRTVVMLSQVQDVRARIGSKPKLRHPCFNSGLVQNYTCNGCSGLRTKGLTSLTLVGDSNWELCRELVRAATTNSSTSDWSQLAVSSKCKAASTGSNLLNLTMGSGAFAHFHALSGFFVVYSMLNFSARANMTRMWERGQQLCSRSWADLASISDNQKYAGQYCFRVPYVASLIEDALCLSDADIYFGPEDVSWTLGAALVEGKYLWLSNEFQTGISSVKFWDVISSPIFLFILLLVLMFIVYHRQIKLPMLGKKAAPGVSLPSSIHSKHRPH